jgi:DNA polymerase-1
MEYKCITRLDEIAAYLEGAKLTAFDFETSPTEKYRQDERAALDAHKAQITGMSFSVAEGSAVYLPLTHKVGKNTETPEATLQYLREALFEKHPSNEGRS